MLSLLGCERTSWAEVLPVPDRSRGIHRVSSSQGMSCHADGYNLRCARHRGAKTFANASPPSLLPPCPTVTITNRIQPNSVRNCCEDSVGHRECLPTQALEAGTTHSGDEASEKTRPQGSSVRQRRRFQARASMRSMCTRVPRQHDRRRCS